MSTPLFNVGSKVIYTNPQGVFLGERTIVGIENEDSSKEPRYYIDPTDTPWYPVRESSLKAIE